MTTVASIPSASPGHPPAGEASRGSRSEEFWSTPIDELFADVRSSSAGLTDDEASRRLIADGPNVAFRRDRSGGKFRRRPESFLQRPGSSLVVPRPAIALRAE